MNMNIVNLKQEPEHIQMLAKWHHDEWSYLNPEGSIQKRIEKMQSYLNDELVPSTFIAKQQGRLMGSAAIVEHDMDTRLELSPWLASVFVAPEYRCKGIGSKLVLQVMSRARDAGVSKLYLFTPDMERLYKKLGWSTIDQEIYRGHEVTVMQIVLNG